MSEETSTPTSLPIPPPIPQTVTENSSTEEDKQETFTKTADVQQITLRKPSKVKELVKLNEQMLQKKKKSLVLPASVSGSLRPSRSRDFRFSFKKKSRQSTKGFGFGKLKKVANAVADKNNSKEQEQVPVITLDSFPENSLQKTVPNAVHLQNKRNKAKKVYLAQHRELQVEYERKARELHQTFFEEVNHLMSHPVVKVKEVKKITVEKAEDDTSSKEKTGETKVKKEEEAVIEVSRSELDTLKDMWFSISIKQWDVLCSKAYPGDYRPDLWEQLRKKHDHDIAHEVGSTKSKNSKRIKEGDCSHWLLNLLRNEEDNARILPKKKENAENKFLKLAIKIAGVDDNKTNREKASKAIKEAQAADPTAPVPPLRAAVNSLANDNLTESKSRRLNVEEAKLMRSVVVRVVDVDVETETVRLVLVLDRNGRPCIGGLPKEEYQQKKEYEGEDKIIALETQPGPVPVPIENVGEELASTQSNSEDSADEETNIELDESTNSDNEDAASEGSESELIDGFRTTEQPEGKPREYPIRLHELLATDGISIIPGDMKSYYKSQFNSKIPHITYQRISGFEVYNNNLNSNGENGNKAKRARRRRDYWDDAGDFQLVDLGFKLGLEPLDPIEEYDQVWRNGVLYALKHSTDGHIRFVGYNETGFGFFEDKPIGLYTQAIKDKEGNITGVNVVHMNLFDTNEQVSFDTLYLKDEEDMGESKKWKVFGKDAIGNRLAYRVVAKKGKVEAVLYPFQGRVKKAKLQVNDMTNLEEGSWVNIHTMGQTGLRLAQIRTVPTGMVIGAIGEEKKCKFEPTPFLEMLRVGQRGVGEVPGLIDVEIFTEDSLLCEKPRQEAWPVECLHIVTEEQMKVYHSLQGEKEEKLLAVQSDARALMNDVKSFLGDRAKRQNKEQFQQEAEALAQSLQDMKLKLEVDSSNKTNAKESADSESKTKLKKSPKEQPKEKKVQKTPREGVVYELNETLKLIQKNIEGAKRAAALIRRSIKREKKGKTAEIADTDI